MFGSKKKKSTKKTVKSTKKSSLSKSKQEPVSRRKELRQPQNKANPVEKETLDNAVTNFKKMMDDKRVKQYFKDKTKG